MFLELLFVFIATFLGTGALNIIFRFLGKRGYMGNLYEPVRGGTPRGIGIIPFIVISLFLPAGFNNLVLVMGLCALVDDVIGRRRIANLPIEIGQLARGIGMLCVIGLGYPLMGISSILVALMIQPMNIADMQPGSAVSVVIIMSFFTILATLIIGAAPVAQIPAYYVPLLTLVTCIAYAPLDYSGKIMLGEVGNHTFALALGIGFYILGGFVGTLILFIVTTALIAYIRRRKLSRFLINKLHINNPTFGDLFMDVLTGGGLGDLFRKIILGERQQVVTDNLLISLGFRRLLYNPYSPNLERVIEKDVRTKPTDLRKLS
ncbi:cell wall biosynthesis protein [uncultured Methanobrevibacter sp.]|uniref:cell wall biosynthesis protein n=1 Tax=uncultured Methanobrevibacter sp. TaxID=253161 RepID=UPI0025D90B49|nr:cell wall biosynthesis protein [uncultured Methanobrevibacter sp.]